MKELILMLVTYVLATVYSGQDLTHDAINFVTH